METINGIAQAAAKAVWGENTTDGKEPVSGQQGNVSAGEPYDKGNIEEPSATTSTTGQSATGSSLTGKSLTDRSTNDHSTTRDFTNDKPDYTAGDSAIGHSTTGHSTTDHSTSGPSDISKGAEFAKTTGTAAESDQIPNNEQTDLKAKDTPVDTSKGQADVRDPKNPQTNPKNNPTDVNNTEEGVSEGQKLDGPGPKPLIEVAKEHGGDAGNKETKPLSGSKDKGESAPESDDPNDPRAPSKGEGTGEKYVKSSGLAADGGDFDASNPGAGREADRILEEKGIHVTKGAPKTDDDGTHTGTTDDKEKKSLKDKIKDKLHRH